MAVGPYHLCQRTNPCVTSSWYHGRRDFSKLHGNPWPLLLRLEDLLHFKALPVRNSSWVHSHYNKRTIAPKLYLALTLCTCFLYSPSNTLKLLKSSGLCALATPEIPTFPAQTDCWDFKLGLHLICTASSTQINFWADENKSLTIEPPQRTLCRGIQLHSMQESLDSDRETIGTHSLLSKTSVKPWNHMHDVNQEFSYKKTKHSWAHKHIHRETNTSHEIESKSLSINPIYTWGLSTSSLICSSLALVLNNSECSECIKCTKEGAYNLFSLSRTGTIKSTINSYLTTLKLLNAFLSILQYKCASLWMLHKRAAQQFPRYFKIWCWRCPVVLLPPRAGSLGEVWMLLHQF